MKGLGQALLIGATAAIISACDGGNTNAEKVEQNASTQPDLSQQVLESKDPQESLDLLRQQCVDAEELLIQDRELQEALNKHYVFGVKSSKLLFESWLENMNFPVETSVQQVHELLMKDGSALGDSNLSITDEQRNEFYSFYEAFRKYLRKIGYEQDTVPTFDAILADLAASTDQSADTNHTSIPYYCSEAYLQNMHERIQQHKLQKQQPTWYKKLLLQIISAGAKIF